MKKGTEKIVRAWTILLICLTLILGAAGCAQPRPDSPETSIPPESSTDPEPEETVVVPAKTKSITSLSATDALGRSFSPVSSLIEERQVGIFYFLWIGEHNSTGASSDGRTLDISKMSVDELKSGSDVGRHHYWGEPLYGYYRSDDPWVFGKHLELLTLAGVDYLVFDYTNSNYDSGKVVNYYKDVTDQIFPVALKMQAEGWDIPKFVFMLNASADKTVKQLYEDYYQNPDYDSLWYRAPDGLSENKNPEGKPWVICGDAVQFLEADIRDYFHIKQTQWPNEAPSTDGVWDFKYKDNGFPWMSWERTKNGTRKQYSHDGIMSVSISQHLSGAFSDPVLQGGYNSCYGRGWSSLDNNGSGGNSKERVAAGTNFQEQWDYALSQARAGKVNNIFVTGWNEWVAQKQPAGNGRPNSYFVDLYDAEFSRDAEMTAGELGDNFYLQLCRNIRAFKGLPAASSSLRLARKTIDLEGGLGQWEEVQAFADPEGDTAARDHASSNASLPALVNDTGRNDIVQTQVVRDGKNLTFLITCAGEITPYEAGDKTWMNLFLGVGAGGWNNFQFVVNRTVNGNTALIERLNGEGEAVSTAGKAEIRVSGNHLIVQIPLKALGVSDDFTLTFKVSDHVTDYADILSYYVDGDSAPIGRLSYTAKG